MESTNLKFHKTLSQYFLVKARGTDAKKEWETSHIRGFGEVVFQLVKSEEFGTAKDLLSSFPFVFNKIRSGLLEDVLEDYPLLNEVATKEIIEQLKIWIAFFREKAHILRRGSGQWPSYKIFVQLAVEHADDSPITMCAEKWLEEGRCDWVWLCSVYRPLNPDIPSNITTFEGHVGYIHDVKNMGNNRLLTVGSDDTIRLWDINSGDCLSVLDDLDTERTINTPEMHIDDQEMKEKYSISWQCNNSDDSLEGVIRIIDSKSGIETQRLRGHSRDISGYLFLNNRELLTWSEDDTSIRIWDINAGFCKVSLRTNKFRILGALPIDDHRIVYWFDDGDIKLWDSDKSNSEGETDYHWREVYRLFPLDNGWLVSTAFDHMIHVWDCSNGKCIGRMDGSGVGQLSGIWNLDEDRLLSWTTWHLQLWECRTGTLLTEIKDTEAPEDWLNIRANASWYGKRCNHFVVEDVEYGLSRATHLISETYEVEVATWHANSRIPESCVLPDGTVVVGLDTGKICILKLHEGSRQLSLGELNAELRVRELHRISEIAILIKQNRFVEAQSSILRACDLEDIPINQLRTSSSLFYLEDIRKQIEQYLDVGMMLGEPLELYHYCQRRWRAFLRFFRELSILIRDSHKEANGC